MSKEIKEKIPVSNPLANYLIHKELIDNIIAKVLSSGKYILGDEVRSFENEFASYIGVKHCIGVGNGTEALALSLWGLGIQNGDEIITVSHTAVATISAIELVGAIPVFCDIEPSHRCIDVNLVEELISEKTKAILPVHIYGHPAPMLELPSIAKKYNLFIIEDCAQAAGAEINFQKVGSFGNISAFSFYPTKNLGAIGDGGAVVTNSDELADKVRWLREYGWKKRFISHFKGINSRLDEIQASILRVKLQFLDQENNRRNEIAKKYEQALNGFNEIILPTVLSGYTHSWHLYVIETDERDSLANYLNKNFIDTALHYPLPVHKQPAYLNRARNRENLTKTERLYKRHLTLPMYPELEDWQIDKICSSIQNWIRKI